MKNFCSLIEAFDISVPSTSSFTPYACSISGVRKSYVSTLSNSLSALCSDALKPLPLWFFLIFFKPAIIDPMVPA